MWLVQPITQKEESMHSLLMRLSAGNDISIQAARSILFATDKKQDLDKISTFHASLVADAANLSEKQAQSLACRKWNGKLIADMDSGRNNFDWLPALPFRKGEAKDEDLPLAYPRCIPCLQEGGLPYARITHRLAFVTCCPKHKVFLVSKCHACGNHLHFPNSEPFLCIACGKDQRSALEPAPQAFIEA